MFFELREYRIASGRRDEWARLMETQIVPIQVAKGMVITGSFVATEDPDLYVWLRRFEDEAERDRLYEAVYESPEWKAIEPLVDELIKDQDITVTHLVATAKSPIR